MNKTIAFVILGVVVVICATIIILRADTTKVEAPVAIVSPQATITPVNKVVEAIPVSTKEKIITEQKEEETASEHFIEQPGLVKLINLKSNGQWEVSVDLLTKNPEWLPGSSIEPFFINQNPKIRVLTTTKNTRAYGCVGAKATDPQTVTEFLSDMQLQAAHSGNGGYTAYFDIDGTTITALYEQCLP